MTSPTCVLCDAAADGGDVVCRADGWHARVFPGLEVPGWYVLQLDRHAEGLAGMTYSESIGLGRQLRRLVDGIERTLPADTVYATCFGEVNRHLHFLVAARPAHVPTERRQGRLLEHAADLRDPDAAEIAAGRLASLLSEAS